MTPENIKICNHLKLVLQQGGESVDWIFFIDLVKEYGYVSLFLIMAFGLFLIPVPNEILLMSGGLLATTYFLEPIPTFLVLYASIIYHGSFLFLIGKMVSRKSPQQTKHRSKWRLRVHQGKELVNKYGLKAASFSYFFPFIRHAVPLGIGMSKISFRLFALVGFGSGLVWMSIYFLIGFYYGRTIKDWSSFVEQMIYSLAVVGVVVFIYHYVKRRRQHQKQYNEYKT